MMFRLYRNAEIYFKTVNDNSVRRKVKKLFKNFEKLLEEHGTTIYRVSADTGIPQATLYEWKSGKYTPKVDKLQKIADYFKVPLETLIKGGEG